MSKLIELLALLLSIYQRFCFSDANIWKSFVNSKFSKNFFFEREVGFKPTTFRLEIWHSNQLNYSRKWSGKRDSDARPQPWQGCTLTNWATSACYPIYKYIDVFFYSANIWKSFVNSKFSKNFFLFLFCSSNETRTHML